MHKIPQNGRMQICESALSGWWPFRWERVARCPQQKALRQSGVSKAEAGQGPGQDEGPAADKVQREKYVLIKAEMKQRYRYFLFAHSFVCGREGKEGGGKWQAEEGRSALRPAAFSFPANQKW